MIADGNRPLNLSGDDLIQTESSTHFCQIIQYINIERNTFPPPFQKKKQEGIQLGDVHTFTRSLPCLQKCSNTETNMIFLKIPISFPLYLNKLKGKAFVKNSVDLGTTREIFCGHLSPKAFNIPVKVHTKLLDHPVILTFEKSRCWLAYPNMMWFNAEMIINITHRVVNLQQVFHQEFVNMLSTCVKLLIRVGVGEAARCYFLKSKWMPPFRSQYTCSKKLPRWGWGQTQMWRPQ